MRRPTFTVIFAGAALLLVLLSLWLPWFIASSSSGNRAPPGEPAIVDRDDTIVAPYRPTSTQTLPEAAAQASRWLGILLTVVATSLATLLLLDARFDDRESWRRPFLTIAWSTIGILAATLTWAALTFPDATGAPGLVRHENIEDGFLSGYPLAGAFVAMAALVPLFAYVGIRHASGSLEWRTQGPVSS